MADRRPVWHDAAHDGGIAHNLPCDRLIDTEFLVQQRKNTACCKRDNTAKRRDRGEHAVDALSGDILLIIADIGLDRRGQDLGKGVHQRVHPEADDQQCQAVHERIHQSDKNDIEHISHNQHAALAPLADTERGCHHADKTGRLAEERDQRVLPAGAHAAVVIQPLEHGSDGGLQEAEPAGQRNHPEVLVAHNLTQGIHKLDLNDVCLGLDNLFLCVGVDHDAQHDTEDAQRGIDIPVQPDIVHIVVGEPLGKQRHGQSHNGGRNGVDNAFDGGDVRALLGVWGEDVQQVVI